MAKKQKKVLDKQQKRNRTVRGLVIFFIVVAFFGLFLCTCATTAQIGRQNNYQIISSFAPVDYSTVEGGQIVPVKENGYYTFKTDRELKVMQLTDLHIGAGAFSEANDRVALNAIAALIQSQKPDFVIVTGDAAYPIVFQAGTGDNKVEANMVGTLFEQLGVYWTICFGNHDTESFSLYDRTEIGDYYANNPEFEHCLLEQGPTPDTVYGYGNQVFLSKRSDGKITQAYVTIDSHDYVGNKLIGAIAWNYDWIHQEQMDWYKEQMLALKAANLGITVKSLVFFHIPLFEYQEAWDAFKANSYQASGDGYTHYYGWSGEKDELSYPGGKNLGFFDLMVEVGGQGVFCGHDHDNNYSIDYTKECTLSDGSKVNGTVRLTYGLSIDCLAYSGIMGRDYQRGGTLIRVANDGSFTVNPVPVNPEAYQAYSDSFFAERA